MLIPCRCGHEPTVERIHIHGHKHKFALVWIAWRKNPECPNALQTGKVLWHRRENAIAEWNRRMGL